MKHSGRGTSVRWHVWAIALALVAGAVLPAMAFGVKPPVASLDGKSFVKPELRVVESAARAEGIAATLPNMKDYDTFLAENGTAWYFLIEQKTGRVSLLDGGAIPFIPGNANGLAWASVGVSCDQNECIPVAQVEALARQFLWKYQGAFRINPDELVLARDGSGPAGNSMYFLRFQWVYAGVPVEGASVFFRINNGNLIQVATTKIGDISLDTKPAFAPETALQILNGYLGADALTEKDEILEKGQLAIIPTSLKGVDPDTYAGGFGREIAYHLVYRLVFRRQGVQGTWEGIVDASTGELLRFVDSNRYGHVHGGIRPSDGLPPEEDRPFPMADIGGGLYTDSAGNFTGNNATVTLTGKYCHIGDACGAISAVTTTGAIDFGSGAAGTDCTVPTGNTYGAGNTKPSRTLFYNVSNINVRAQVWNPSNTWLPNNYVTCNVNGAASCNASSGGGVINFYKQVAGTCNNLGEIPAVAMHEWGHSYDANDGVPVLTPPVETYADWTAIMSTHNSCTGAGFLISGNCGGYGNPCTGCTGVRDCDYTKHNPATPWTSANHGTLWTCSGGSYNGPCGWEDHCESGISTQALWDFVYRDLEAAPTNMDITSAWMLEDRLWFTGVQTLANMYTCSAGVTSGCTGNVLYTVMRAIDDDGDGTANGTPHAAAIFAALNRHGLACGLVGDATNQNHVNASCPTQTITTLSGAAGNNQVVLNWPAVTNATRYWIFKNEGTCATGFTRIATVNAPTTTYTDNGCSNGTAYNYRFQSATASDSCTSLVSNCITMTPQPCTASVGLDKTLYSCAGTVNVTVLDSTPGGSPWSGQAWSTSDAVHRTFTIAGTVPNLTGSFTTTSGAGGAGVVHVANGDTLTVRFVDPDNCGGGSLNVDQTALIDCVGPVITNVLVTNITDAGATITWTTNENANSRVTYGTATPPGTNKDDLANYVTSHSVNIIGLNTCTKYYFSVTSSDVAANSTTDTNGGTYYSFTTAGRTFAMGPDNVEGGVLSWVATGTAGALWHQDTCQSHSATHAWKAGAAQGTCPGTYVATADTYLTWNANINLGAAGHGLHLYFWEAYTTESGYDYCHPQVSTDGGTTWVDLASYAGTGAWAQKDYDLAAYTGATVRIRFWFHSDGSVNYEGWYVDDISVSKSQACSADPRYQSLSRTDVCGAGGAGNNNGILDPGEDSVVTITMVNGGMAAATTVSATLSTSTPGITVTDNSATFPNIAANGGTGVSQPNHYSVHVDSGIACGTVANFTLHAVCTEVPSGVDSGFTMTVGQAGGTITDMSQDFTSVTPPALPAGWTVSHTSGNDWLTSASYYCNAANGLYYPYNSSQAANSWAYTPSMTLTAGVTYTLNFNQKVQSATFPEALEVKAGTAATPAGQTIMIWTQTGLVNTTCTARAPTFTVPSTGTYYLSFHCTSAADEYYLIVDDISLTHVQAASCTVCTCTAPGAPNLTAATGDCSGVNLTWTAGTGTTNSYNAYRSTNTTCPVGTLTKLNASPIPSGTLSYADTTAVAGTTYTYVVRGACDAGGTTESVNSNCRAAARLAVPAAPAAPTFTGVGQTSITVNWGAVGGATNYDVWRQTGASCTGASKITASPVAGLSYADNTVTCGNTYSYFVTANNACGASANGACNTQATSACSSAPKPVPDGRLSGTAMKGTRVAVDGSSLNCTYDTSTCSVPDHSIIYGTLANVATVTPSGGVCSIGNASPYSWTSVPAGNIWWVIVGDGGTTESSWGQKYVGGSYSERSASASNQCGNTTLNTSGTCP